MKDIYQEVKMNELADPELLLYIGFLYEELKSIDERLKNDEHIIKILEDLKEYKEQHYLAGKKTYRAHLKAARVIAQARGLKFDVPELSKDKG